MDITKRIKNAVAAFRKNSIDTTLGVDPNAFLTYGKRMPSVWSTPEISDQDFYTGYGFAVINKRANRSVVLGKNFIFTDAKENIVKEANDKNIVLTHPYLKLIRESVDFAERDFWYDISTYLDLEGIYYLMAVRTVAGGRVGNVQKFSLLNPYWVRQVINSDGELGGYVENNPHKGTREISKELIIPVRLLNPFDPTKSWSLADAARDSQFTMKQANDYARESINGNINSPGILSSAIELPDDQFDNFVNRVKNHGRGEPLFGNGAGTVSWVDMQTDLDKAALDKINSINRDVLLAISGLSKTGVGVEESGTGREVSRTQKDDFTENAIMPQIENIIDALNLDYRRFYADQYTKNNYVIALNNPLETAHDAEQVDVDIRDSQFALFTTLVDKGYDTEIASKFAKGTIDITDLGDPTNPPESTDTAPTDTPVDTPPVDPTSTNSVNNQISAYDIPGLYDQMNIDFENLGYIMLDTEKISVSEYIDGYVDDVYDDGDHTGIAAEVEPHVTLLSGLLQSGHTWRNEVDQVLEGWKCNSVTIDKISFFDMGESYAIVGLVDKSKQLVDGHERLTLLPHINTFSEYVPHITLAYVKHDEKIKNKWVRLLNKQYAGAKIKTTGINYGDLPEASDSTDTSYDNKVFEVYQGYAIPVLQYLGDLSDQIFPLSEESSFIFSNDSILAAAAKKKTVHIHHLEESGRSLIGVVDNTTFIKLGEFKQNADRVAILARLNKRYKNQAVAVKQKINLEHNHEGLYDKIKNAAFDKQVQIDANTQDLLTSAQAAEDALYNEYSQQISAGNLSPKVDSLESYVNSLTLPFAVYFTVMFPIYASHHVQETAKEQNISDQLPLVAMTTEVKDKINTFAQKEASSHMNTLKTDIENALAIIRTKTNDPQVMQQMFAEAYADIRARRAQAIANNAAARIFNLSQYEADLQFLTRAGLLHKAYKVLFSLSGDPCQFCSLLIKLTNDNPIPFTQAFADMGDTLEVDGQALSLNYESIIAGNVHPNCRCAYRLILED